jgi:hypothetical protein
MRVMEWNKYNTAPREITMGYVVRVLLMAGGVWAEVHEQHAYTHTLKPILHMHTFSNGNRYSY